MLANVAGEVVGFGLAAGVGAATGLAMGAVVAALTGLALAWLVRGPHREPEPQALPHPGVA
jgi:hypothetical protein